jgi:hypothetical protein
MLGTGDVGPVGSGTFECDEAMASEIDVSEDSGAEPPRC